MSNEVAVKSFIEGGWHISYLSYHATGEGVRISIGVGGSRKHAEGLLKGKLDEHFHRLIESSPICANSSVESMQMIDLIPRTVQETLGTIPLGAGEYYAELYYNLS